MFLFFIILFVLSLFSLKIKWVGLDSQYLSKKNTQAIKGIFVIFVFLSHIRTYASYHSYFEQMTIQCLDYLGQLMVTLFLFYSGYGIFEAIKAKGQVYIDSIPKKRIGSTFIDFSFALVLFMILNQFLDIHYSLKTIILSFSGWSSIGNSNWYMFTIFALYFLTYISFKFIKKNCFFSLIVFSTLSLGYVYILSRLQPSRFSNTALCYCAGMWYSYFKGDIDSFFHKHQWFYYVALISIIAIYLFVYPYKGVRIMYFNGVSIVFCLMIVMLSMKISINHPLFIWFGQHLFWIYILQRIPMIALSQIPQMNSYVYLYLTFFITLLLSLIINQVMGKVKRKIYR